MGQTCPRCNEEVYLGKRFPDGAVSHWCTVCGARWKDDREAERRFAEAITGFYMDIRTLGMFTEVELHHMGPDVYERLSPEWQRRTDAFYALCKRRRERYGLEY